MSNIVTIAPGAKLPAYLSNRAALPSINADVIGRGIGYPVLSIKGKVFTLVKGSERKVLTRADDPDEVLQSLTLTVIRANTKTRVFYAKAYTEGAEGESSRPDCYSADGVAPAADARNPQAKKCQLCPHAAWGSKAGSDGKGTACTVNTRLAVADPEELEPYLLRVPAGSRANFADVVKMAEARGVPYNAMALKLSFDKEAPSPKLTFKIVGFVNDDTYEKVRVLFDDETVKDIVGLGPVAPAQHNDQELPAGAANAADLDALIAAKAVVQKAQAIPAPKAKPAPAAEVTADDLDALFEAPAAKPAPKAKPKADVDDVAPKAVAKPKPAPVAADDGGDFGGLLGDLDALLASTDD